ncbi:MAG: pyridoxal 5'-phosphate synthase glutaminase subunit PdxT [Prevotella ruminicola]|jgi:5'-phosphate synthase pdxT subunit|uniref:Pyridoxal 5'-phosphate synthase subunit PdxT n=1 Tax=Xylanibacter ruminicola TaxID=839 RepID=A0A928BQ72_XYLRU|nr:pyridoxal 5'-phosphate synthase glutaminase subunit PdxT [Xylanibacter ruminicola]
MKAAVLALQGAFIEHEQVLQRLGIETVEIRQLSDWQQGRWDALILPGGESTVQMRLLKELGLFEPIRKAISDGLPVLGTCAGMILLSDGYLGTMHIRVRRNAYGRQLGSFHTTGAVDGIGADVPMTFIRAPYIEKVLADDCSPIAIVDGHIVAARQGNQIATAFHPELDEDLRLHQFLIDMI